MATQFAPSDTAAATTWKIDPSHSHIEFAVKHLMIATVKGRFNGVNGSVQITGDDPATAHVDVSIDVATIDTREGQRDAHLRSADFFDAAKFPTLTFHSTAVTGVTSDGFTLTGDLTIHGVTKPVSLNVAHEGRAADPWGGQRAGYSATGKIKRSDFGLSWNQVLEAGGVVVSDDVKIALDVELVKA